MCLDERHAEEVFYAVLEHRDSAGRGTVLDAACDDNPELRQRVERLLAAHAGLGDFLRNPSARLLPAAASAEVGSGPPIDPDPITSLDDGTGLVGQVLDGRYRLLEVIGEGGMGTVYLADQTTPVQRRVAVKLLKPGLNSAHVLFRFEAERQALAVMDHAHIARVFDGGETPPAYAGGLPRPFFVMELVQGVPITRFCDERRLSVRERLELFIPVCQAIQHAHQKGIIHRDLKPGNVLVSLCDGRAHPKVIDFGIAKAVAQPPTVQTSFTGFGMLIGTPEYMSPEQAELNQVDIDTRTDVYSLGVLLYELLAGSVPFSRATSAEVPLLDLLGMIREKEPLRPSDRVQGSRTNPLVAANRGTNPDRLSRILRGELDWVVMKSLEKSRERRYATAREVGEELQRFLDGQPILARPIGFREKARRWGRRNPAVAALTAVLLLTFLAGFAGVTWKWREADLAWTQEHRTRKVADDRAEEIHQGLERLKAANSLRDRGDWYAEALRWDDAHAAFTKALELRPDDKLGWLRRGDMYTRLGLWELAKEDFARAFELQESDISVHWFQHALLCRYVGDVNGYRLVCRTMRERFSGSGNRDFLDLLVRSCVLAPDDTAAPAELVELARRGLAGEPRAWYPLYLLGIAHHRAGQQEQAVQRLRESLDGNPAWECSAISYPVLAMAYYRLGQVAEARLALDAAAAAIDRWTQERYQAQDVDHWAIHQGAVASWPILWWDWLDCQLYYHEASVLIDGSPPPADPRLHVLRARSFAGLRWNAKADVEYTAALKLLPHDPQIRLEAHRNRGYCCAHLGQWVEAAAAFDRASELQPDEVYLWFFRAVAHRAAGEGSAYRQTCVALAERFQKTEDPRTACHVVVTCVLSGDALPDMTRLLRLARVGAGWFQFGASAHGAALYRAGRYDEAVRYFEAEARTYRLRAWDWCFLAMAQHRLGHSGEARRCLTEAARWIDEANREELDDLTGTRPAWGIWCEQVMYPLLLREAEELIGSPTLER